jgi:hypothetical protein
LHLRNTTLDITKPDEPFLLTSFKTDVISRPVRRRGTKCQVSSTRLSSETSTILGRCVCFEVRHAIRPYALTYSSGKEKRGTAIGPVHFIVVTIGSAGDLFPSSLWRWRRAHAATA